MLLPPLVDHKVPTSKYGEGGVGAVTIILDILTLLLGAGFIVFYFQLRTMRMKIADCERVFRFEDISEGVTSNLKPSRLPRCQVSCQSLQF